MVDSAEAALERLHGPAERHHPRREAPRHEPAWSSWSCRSSATPACASIVVSGYVSEEQARECLRPGGARVPGQAGPLGGARHRLAPSAAPGPRTRGERTATTSSVTAERAGDRPVVAIRRDACAPRWLARARRGDRQRTGGGALTTQVAWSPRARTGGWRMLRSSSRSSLASPSARRNSLFSVDIGVAASLLSRNEVGRRIIGGPFHIVFTTGVRIPIYRPSARAIGSSHVRWWPLPRRQARGYAHAGAAYTFR